MKAWWWGLGCVLLFCGTVSAHDCDAKAIRKEMKHLKAEIVALKSRVDSLEKNTISWNKIESPKQNLDEIYHNFLYLIPDNLPVDTMKNIKMLEVK